MFDDTYYTKILMYLDDFHIKDESSEITPDDASYSKLLTKKEVNAFYDIAMLNTVSYLNLNDACEIQSVLLPFVYMWAAGLIYKKYDIRVNDLEDETMPVGYGDQLIISAKAGLKPYKQYSMMAW